MSQTAAHLVDHVSPHVPVRWRVMSLPIVRRQLLTVQPQLIAPVLAMVQRVLTWHLLETRSQRHRARGDRRHF